MLVVALLALAAALEIAGLWTAAVGFKRTWREHAPGQDFWEPDKARARSARELAVQGLRRMIGKPATQHITFGAAHIDLGPGSLTARGEVTWWPSPDPADLPAMVAEMNRRTNELRAALQRVRHDLADELTARKAGDEAADEAMREEVATVVRSTQRVAVGGLRLQVRGWFLVLAGIVLGTIANICQAIAS